MKRIIMWAFAVLALAAYTAAWLTPATWWYQPGRIVIRDTVFGGDPTVEIQRQIRRSFDGRYTVSIWRNPPDGHVSCAGSDTLRYKGGMYAPHEAPLSQWAEDPWCSKLPVGTYYAEACWTVLRPFWGIVPGKTVCTTTPFFHVAEADK